MLKVINPGIYSSVQDQGRFGFAHIGVPVSGCMDQVAANFANCILGNSLKDAVLEFTFGLAKLEFLSPTIICISGAACAPKLNAASVAMNTPISIQEKDVLSFGTVSEGIRTYLAVKNGFQTEIKLASKSQYQHITTSASIQKNDLLYFEAFTKPLTHCNAKLKLDLSRFSQNELPCFEGPEFYLLSKQQKQLLLHTSFTISNDANRMGYRLNKEISNQLTPIVTSSVLPGTVQLTPSGRIIILMKDCQVTGGYPRILQLTKEAIAVLSQKHTNQQISFKSVDFFNSSITY